MSNTPAFRRGSARSTTAVAPARAERTNRYAGRCFACNEVVPANEGRLLYSEETSRWLVGHQGACPTAEVKVEVQTPAPTAVGIQDGYYTLLTDEGHRTFRVKTQKEDSRFAPGQQVIAFLSGSDNERDYENFGFIKGGAVRVWPRYLGNGELVRDAKAFSLDPEAALVSARCKKCFRKLTTPEAITRGMGPECAQRNYR